MSDQPAKHGHQHGPDGPDPIPASVIPSALGNGFKSITITGDDVIEMQAMYATSGGYYEPDGGNPLAFDFINLMQDGFYVADFSVYWVTVFASATGPNLEPACQIAGTPDTLINSVAEYWDTFEGWIGGEQLDSGELAHHQLIAKVSFNYRAADIDPDFGIGVRLVSSGTGTKGVGCSLRVTRMGDALETVT